MKILLSRAIEKKLISALKQADSREIGGILMGECVRSGVYRIYDLTIQRQTGTVLSFLRLVLHAVASLGRFFFETGYDFRRFNYLGEWHSHPSVALDPSRVDSETMWAIVDDPQVGANFAILMIVRLSSSDCLEGAVTAYLAGRRRVEGELIREMQLHDESQ
jgi:hypothetical protein